MSKSDMKTCPKCKKKSLERDFQAGGAPNIISSEPKTVGQLGERNFKALSADEKAKLVASTGKKKAPVPWWRNGRIKGTKRSDKPIDITKVKDTKKYIETGETSD